MNRFQRSWELVKSSLAVMGRDKKLLLFPILNSFCVGLIVALFLVPVALLPTGHSYASPEHWEAVAARTFGERPQPEATTKMVSDGNSLRMTGTKAKTYRARPMAAVYFGALYFGAMFVATFLNVAFYSQILNGLAGRGVSIFAGLRYACTRWRTILAWTLFAGIVGYLVKLLEQRFGFLGQLIMRLVGAAWSIACVFAIPVVVTRENTFNPFLVLKDSALTLTRTWGESLIGYAGIAFGNLLVFIASLIWLGGGIALAVSLQIYWLIAVVAVVWVLAISLWGYLLSVASQIFRCALFLYATTGTLPAPFTGEMMELAWKRKKGA